MSILKAINRLPQGQAIGGSIIITFGLAGLIYGVLSNKGEVVPTMNPQWKAANKAYMRFQKMNPINGISRDL